MLIHGSAYTWACLYMGMLTHGHAYTWTCLYMGMLVCSQLFLVQARALWSTGMNMSNSGVQIVHTQIYM
jgi:hypothetical protein